MIPSDFDYYRPDTVEEAVSLYRALADADKYPMYYGGGTEIITMDRVHNLSTGAVIDIKGIPECKHLGFSDGHLVIGAGVSLTRISESKLWPLLAKAGGRIADHTTQGKITLGGNICGTILYHEALLPLLLTDSEATVAGTGGQRRVPVRELFRERCLLRPGELLVNIRVGEEKLELPYIHVKRTKCEKIDYPLISVAAILREDGIKVAFSGMCAFPFRSEEIEHHLNEQSLSSEQRIENALTSLPAPPLDDISGSAGYRRFILASVLSNILSSFEDKNHV